MQNSGNHLNKPDGGRNGPRRRHSPNSNRMEVEEGAIGGRRDEGALSFRHFLQPQSDVVPVRGRRWDGHSGGDVSGGGDMGGLPDFVQDHLVLEGEQRALDLSVLGDILPDFASHSNTSRPVKARRRVGEEDLAPPALPDFLSDGPMQCSSTAPAASPPSRLHNDPETLRRELHDRNRRIEELERELVGQRSETGRALRAASEALEAANLRASEAERTVSELRTDLAILRGVGGEGLRNGEAESEANRILSIARSSCNRLVERLGVEMREFEKSTAGLNLPREK